MQLVALAAQTALTLTPLSLAVAAPTRCAALLQPVFADLTSCTRFASYCFGSARLGSARLCCSHCLLVVGSHGSLTVDYVSRLARLQFSIVPQRQSKSNVCRVYVDTLCYRRSRSRRCRRSCACACAAARRIDVASFLQLARKCPTAAQQLQAGK